MNMRTLSLAALTLLDVPPPEQVRIAARTGFTHVGLRLLPATPADPDYDMLGDTPAVRATLSALMETGIRVSDVEIVRLTPGLPSTIGCSGLWRLRRVLAPDRC